jgi:hypothetical protein
VAENDRSIFVLNGEILGERLYFDLAMRPRRLNLNAELCNEWV